MASFLRESCGVGVAYDPHDATLMTAEGLRHRGQDTDGYGRRNGDGIQVIRGYRGRITETALRTILGNHRDTPIIVHTKYRTTGATDSRAVLSAAHPHTLGGEHYFQDGSIRTVGASRALVHNGQIDEELFADYHLSNESGCDSETLLRADDALTPEEVIRSKATTFSVATLNKDEEFVTVYRDFNGRMPFWIGKDKEGNYIAASEDFAIRIIGGTPIREVRPGEIVRMYKDHMESVQAIPSEVMKCFFQANYFSHPKSYLWEELMRRGITLESFRGMLGEMTYRERPIQGIDFVTPLPKTPIPASKSISLISGIPYLELFYKLKKVEPGSEEWIRAFLGLDPIARRKLIEESLFVDEKADPKKIGSNFELDDDSTIRGNNAPVAIAKARAKGFNPKILRNYTPMINGNQDGEELGCRHGIDIPHGSDTIAARNNRDPQRISREIGTETFYPSVEGLLTTFEKVGVRREHLCTECIASTCFKRSLLAKPEKEPTSSSVP